MLLLNADEIERDNADVLPGFSILSSVLAFRWGLAIKQWPFTGLTITARTIIDDE